MTEKYEKKKVELVTAVYRLNLHCHQCARDIKKSLMTTQGIHSVEVDIQKGEIKVRGMIEAEKIHGRIEKISKKKVELVSPKAKIKEAVSTEKKLKEIKEVHLHCHKCEQDLRKKLLKNKGIYSVKTDMKAQTLTVEGTIDPDKLTSFLQNKVHKHAEIITSKLDKNEEKKEKEKITEFKEEKIVEVKFKETNAPYFIHYVYAPQLFSDENPNACSIL